MFYLFKRSLIHTRRCAKGAKKDTTYNPRFFKMLFKYNIQQHQWNFNRNKLPILFLQSSFLKKLTTKKKRGKPILKKTLLYFWFIVKRRYHKQLKRKARRFIKSGFFSVYAGRSFLNKLFFYHTKSKYIARYFNLRTIEYYIYIYNKWLLLYFKAMNTKCFFFTSNPSRKNIYLDELFNVYTTNWNSHSLFFKKNSKLKDVRTAQNWINIKYNTNFYDYSATDLNKLRKYHDTIKIYFVESDSVKKDLILNDFKNILLQDDTPSNFLEIIFYYNNLLYTSVIEECCVTQSIKNYIIEYYTLYK
jgi:hypothetical protein